MILDTVFLTIIDSKILPTVVVIFFNCWTLPTTSSSYTKQIIRTLSQTRLIPATLNSHLCESDRSWDAIFNMLLYCQLCILTSKIDLFFKSCHKLKHYLRDIPLLEFTSSSFSNDCLVSIFSTVDNFICSFSSFKGVSEID